MGTWSSWHFGGFIAVAILAAWSGRSNKNATAPAGYGGWLIVLSLFLIFWAGQELAEFYRVRHQIEVLVPSATDSDAFLTYIRYVMIMTWLEAGLLIGSAVLLLLYRARCTILAVVIALWLAGPVAAGIELALAELYVGDYLLESDYSATAATTLFATVWTWYLFASRRVITTYIRRRK